MLVWPLLSLSARRAVRSARCELRSLRCWIALPHDAFECRERHGFRLNACADPSALAAVGASDANLAALDGIGGVPALSVRDELDVVHAAGTGPLVRTIRLA